LLLALRPQRATVAHATVATVERGRQCHTTRFQLSDIRQLRPVVVGQWLPQPGVLGASPAFAGAQLAKYRPLQIFG
jgi:hypothetical protein